MRMWLKPHKLGSLLHIYVQPGSSRSEIAGIHGDRLKIRIKALPKDGEANQAIIEWISEKLGLSQSRVHLIKGKSSRQKDLVVELLPDKILILWPEIFECR